MLDELTIVVPAFRCAKYLPSALHSAILCRPAEILVAEDQSGDRTLEVAEESAGHVDVPVTVYANPHNLGMSRNWQTAMERVRTPFALKLDCDDIVLPGYVRRAYRYLQANPDVGVIGGWRKLIDDKSHLDPRQLGDLERFYDDSGSIEKFEGIDALRFVVPGQPFPCSSTTIYRMDAWREHGFETRLNWCTDWEYWFRVASTHAIGWHPGRAALYRDYDRNVTASYGRADNSCYEIDLTLRQARDFWPGREARALLRRRMLRNALKYFGSCWRSAKRGRVKEIPRRMVRGIAQTIAAVK